jgi:hypothetical protein
MASVGLRLGMVVATPRCDGILRFLGSTEFGSGEWAGVELPVKEGKTDGRYAQHLSLSSSPHKMRSIMFKKMLILCSSVRGRRYFTCEPGFGVFLPVSQVRAKEQPQPVSPPPEQPASPQSPPPLPSISARVPVPAPPPVSAQSDCSGAEDGNASGDDGVDVTNLLDILDGGSSLPPAPSNSYADAEAQLSATAAAVEDPFAKFGSPASVPPLPHSSLLFSPDPKVSIASTAASSTAIVQADDTGRSITRARRESTISAASNQALRRRCMAEIIKIPKFANLPSSAIELAVTAAVRRTAAPEQEIMQQVRFFKLYLFLSFHKWTGRGR